MSGLERVSFEVTEERFLDVYRKFRSFAAIAIPELTQVEFTVVSNGVAGAPYNIMHIPSATEGGEVRGDAFTANSDGTISIKKDMFACSVCLNAVALTASNDNVVIGIGIGDPAQIPTTPGSQVGENYVSRFRCAREGSGVGDEITWDLTVSPVGKSTTELQVFGLKEGDKIFPVIWTQEADNAVMQIRELIFTVEEISI